MNSGLIKYTGEDLTYEEIQICNGELMTDVITKIFTIVNRIKTNITLNLAVDGCLTIDVTSINSVLQDVIDYIKELKCDSTLQSQINTLTTTVTNLQNTINSLNIENVTICTALSDTVKKTGSDYQLYGFVPFDTVLPYFGSINNFDSFGKGIGEMCGWEIASEICGHFIKYECEGCCNGSTGGIETYTLTQSNIPLMTPSASVEISGTTNAAG